MRKLAVPLTIGAALCLAALFASPAKAQSAHTWIASNGTDSGTCDRSAPCASFSFALSKTDANGEITCADSGNYGGSGNLTINKAITINCEGAIGSTTFGTSSFALIFVTTASSDVVTLRGLDIDGLGAGCGGACGLVRFTGAGVLRLEKVKVNNIHGNGSGIHFAPSGPARLEVSDSFIADNGGNVSSAGILVRPASGGSANVSISRTDLKGNVNGIFVDGSGGGGAVNLAVRDTLVTGSSNAGIVVSGGGAALSALIDRTTVTASVNVGVAVSGGAATVRIGNSAVYGNVTGVLAINGGTLRSYKNNQINGNLTDGTPVAAEGVN
jgi:hypothetical protein